MIRKQRAYSYNLFIKLLNNQFFHLFLTMRSARSRYYIYTILYVYEEEYSFYI